ncbi:hypothetical protein [Planktothrix serta]|nr:hypothetical protein [Planktothrix serta]
MAIFNDNQQENKSVKVAIAGSTVKECKSGDRWLERGNEGTREQGN